MIKVCHITSVHPAKDVRIFHKECRSLAKEYEVYLIAPNAQDEIVEGVHILGVSLPKGRLKRMLNLDAVYKKALEVDAAVYHFHDPELMRIGLKLQRKGKKVVFDSHEDVPQQLLTKEYLPFWSKRPLSAIYAAIEKRCLRQYDALVSVTPSIVERLEKINPKTVMVTNYPSVLEIADNQQISNGGGVYLLCRWRKPAIYA